jgi:hypothetical protein
MVKPTLFRSVLYFTGGDAYGIPRLSRGLKITWGGAQMKKIAFLVMAIVLIAGALGGFAYAQSQDAHQPMVGQKLVGWGLFGNAPGAVPGTIFNTIFVLTNPDCVSQITIDRIQIIADSGTLIYGGPPLDFTGNATALLLGPHQSISTQLAFYYSPLPPDFQDFPLGGLHTVEVSWSGAKGGLPLTGWSYTLTMSYDSDTGNIIQNIASAATSQMINMTQTLTKGK